MSTNTATGTTVLRQALYVRARKGHLGPIARGLSERGQPIGVASLETFLSGAKLPVATLQLLAKELYRDVAKYDPESNLLRSANRAEPKIDGHLARAIRSENVELSRPPAEPAAPGPALRPGEAAAAAARAAAKERLTKSLLDRMARGMAREEAILRVKSGRALVCRHWSGAGDQSASRTPGHACLEGRLI